MKQKKYYCPYCGTTDLRMVWLGSQTGDIYLCGLCHRQYETIEQLFDRLPAYEELGINKDKTQ